METHINPFPGLRTYTASDGVNFHGRAAEIEDVLSLLQENKLVVISGEKGAGKTSLIQAGILPKLKDKFKGQRGKEWSVCSLRPGVLPLENLCYSLSDSGVFYANKKSKTTDKADYLSILRQKEELGLINIFKESELSEIEQNLIIVIDQVEDLFRFPSLYDNEKQLEDNQLFNLIHRTSRQKDLPIYFILAIQSEFISNLNAYGKFVEILNSTLYNLPNLTLQSVEYIIAQTFHQRNVQLSDDITEYYGSVLKEDATALPQIQFVFHDLYKKYGLEVTKEIQFIEFDDINDQQSPLAYCDEQLNIFFNSLSEDEKNQMECLFRGLYHGERAALHFYYQVFDYISDSHKTLYLESLLKKIKHRFGESLEIFSRVNTQGRSEEKIHFQSTDIVTLKYNFFSQWPIIKAWFKKEQEAFSTYTDIHTEAIKYPRESYLSGGFLDRAVRWKENSFYNAKWSEKYDFEYQKSIQYIQESQAVLNSSLAQKRALQNDISRAKKRTNKIILTSLFIGMLLLIFFVYERHEEVNNQRKQSELLAQQQEKNKKLIEKQTNYINQIESSQEKINQLRRDDSLRNLQIIKEARKRNLLLQSKLLDQERIKSLEASNLQKASELSTKRMKIERDSIKAIRLMNDANKKEEIIKETQYFISLKDSISALLYTLNNVSINENDKDLLQKVTKNSMQIFDQLKKYSTRVNRDYDDDNLRQLSLNLLSKLNGKENFIDVEKHQLLKGSNRPLKSLAVSPNSIIATGGTARKLYANSLPTSNGFPNLLEEKFKFDATINALEFIDDDRLVIGLDNSELWIVRLTTGEKFNLYSNRKLKSLKRVQKGSSIIGNLLPSFRSKFYKGIGHIKYAQHDQSIYASQIDKLVKVDLNKLGNSNKEVFTILNFKNFAADEFITSMAFSRQTASLFIATSDGNILIKDLKNDRETLIDNQVLKLGYETAIEIEFYKDKVFIGTLEGGLFVYEISPGGMIKHIGNKRVSYSKINDILFDLNNIYLLSENGDLTIVPSSNFTKANTQIKTPVNIHLGEDNFGYAIESLQTSDETIFITSDHQGNLIYWDLDLQQTFDEITSLYNQNFN